MKVVTAIDSFKGSMTSMEAGFAAAEGIHRVDADAEVQVRPLADGGEGTVEALVAGMNGKTEHVKVTGPLGEPVICEYGIIESTKTAVIEIAGAAGITQVPDEKRNPLYTTTYGVGEVIKDAIEKGCRRFIVGIGGSATNDGGVGMLQALGYAFLDKDGKQVLPGARGLKDITEITAAYVIPELAECKFRVACDVTNPLCGELGCSSIYGPQKGATPEMIQDMDQWLGAYAELAKERFPKADPKYHLQPLSPLSSGSAAHGRAESRSRRVGVLHRHRPSPDAGVASLGHSGDPLRSECFCRRHCAQVLGCPGSIADSYFDDSLPEARARRSGSSQRGSRAHQ